MFVIPWKIHFLINKKLGKYHSSHIEIKGGCIAVTLTWKRWGGLSTRNLTLTFTDKGVEWNHHKDQYLRYSYGYEKMGSYCGYPVIIIDEKAQVSKTVLDAGDCEISSIELFSKTDYERVLVNDMSKIPVFKGNNQL